MSAELTYVAMYILGHVNATLENGNGGAFLLNGTEILLLVCIPGCVVKQIVNVFQLLTSLNAVAEHDAKVKNE